MFHVIPVLKMSVHATYFHIEQLRESEIFKIGVFLYRARKMFLQALIEGKDP